jgi:hypothetical protein
MRALLLSSGLIALMAASHPASAQSKDKAYCLESQAGVRNCLYESLERCQQMVGVRTIGGRCVTNPSQFGTVGSGGLEAPRGSGSHSLDRVPGPLR